MLLASISRKRTRTFFTGALFDARKSARISARLLVSVPEFTRTTLGVKVSVGALGFGEAVGTVVLAAGTVTTWMTSLPAATAVKVSTPLCAGAV